MLPRKTLRTKSSSNDLTEKKEMGIFEQTKDEASLSGMAQEMESRYRDLESWSRKMLLHQGIIESHDPLLSRSIPIVFPSLARHSPTFSTTSSTKLRMRDIVLNLGRHFLLPSSPGAIHWPDAPRININHTPCHQSFTLQEKVFETIGVI